MLNKPIIILLINQKIVGEGQNCESTKWFDYLTQWLLVSGTSAQRILQNMTLIL